MAGTPPPVPGYDPNAAAPSAAGAAAAPGTTSDPTQFNLKGFNTAFKLQTVEPGSAVPTGTTRKSEPLSNAQARVLNEQGAGSAIPVIAVANTKPVIEAVQEFDGWDTNQYNTFKDQAFKLGLTSSKSASKTQVALAWQTVVETAATNNKTTKQILDAATKAGNWNAANFATHPNDVGATGTGNNNSGPDTSSAISTNTSGGVGAGTGAATTTTLSSQINHIDPATAQGIISDSFQKYTGRAAKPEETQAWLKALYTAEEGSDAGSSTQKTTDGTNVNTATTTQKGIGVAGAQYMAQQQAMSAKDYGQYQASTTYLKALMDAIKGPASGM